MKRMWPIMIALTVFPRLLAAQGLDVRALTGEHWYGVYFNGQKAGFAVHNLTVDEAGTVTLSEECQFRLMMANAKQDMRFHSERTYAASGALMRVITVVEDISGPKQFEGVVEGDALRFTRTVAGEVNTKTIPKPQESLQDGLSQAALVNGAPKLGDEVAFSQFDPVYERELKGVSRIIGVEERLFDGAPTKVFRVKTMIKDAGIESVSYVTGDGTLMEDTTATFMVMRLEPKEVAQDVNYSNDVIVSNAALVDQPIEDPRHRQSLALFVKGPLTESQMFNDERQFLAPKDDGFEFRGTRIDLQGFAVVQLPVTDAAVTEWLAPSAFVQSDAPEIAAKAREIVGDEKDAMAASTKLCTWVYQNVRTLYSAELTNALDVLKRMQGDCTEHSILFIALARAIGLPAREVAGLIYVDQNPRGFYFHQWAKVWIGKWIDVDPTFNQPLADVTHIKLAEGDLYEQTKLIPIIGQIAVRLADDGSAPAPAAPATDVVVPPPAPAPPAPAGTASAPAQAPAPTPAPSEKATPAEKVAPEKAGAGKAAPPAPKAGPSEKANAGKDAESKTAAP